MFIPLNTHKDIDILRGQLKHSWLENEILCTQPENVVNRRADGTWERDKKLEKHLHNIELTKKLAVDMVDGFSPAQLVDQLGPLQKLPEKTRAKIKEVVHDAYLENSGISELAESLAKTVEVFDKEFTAFLKVWNEEDDTKLAKAWARVLKQAKRLLLVFEKLPKGVVLP